MSHEPAKWSDPLSCEYVYGSTAKGDGMGGQMMTACGNPLPCAQHPSAQPANKEVFAEDDRFRVVEGYLTGAVGRLKGVHWTVRFTFLTIQLDNGEQIQLTREAVERVE